MSFPLYSPEICPPGWAPTFPVGGACVLQSGNVTRSRLTAGGTLFRSVATAATETVNNITASCVVTQVSGDGTATDVYDVIFNYTDSNGVAQPQITVQQRYDNVGGTYTTNGIDGLRSALTGNSVLTMPPTDIPSMWTPASDADHITQFGTGSPPEMLSLTGGVGIPVYSAAIRTGPTFALFHVGFDDSADDGSSVEVNAISEWTGSQWVPHPSTLYKLDSYGNITPPPPCP